MLFISFTKKVTEVRPLATLAATYITPMQIDKCIYDNAQAQMHIMQVNTKIYVYRYML